jgi:peptidoglycan/xylan/chitin deacetylase (PgdA/CDA1 family)
VEAPSDDPRRRENRLAYRAAVDRPRLALPGGRQVAVWPVVNVEHWLIDNPMPRQILVPPTAASLLPDLPNWAWHEYGMRVGFWRFLEAFSARGLRPTLSINGSVCEAYPRVAGAAHEAGWEFMAHGFHQVPTHRVPDEPGMIARTVETIARLTGQAPRGWLGPGLTETLDTPTTSGRRGSTTWAISSSTTGPAGSRRGTGRWWPCPTRSSSTTSRSWRSSTTGPTSSWRARSPISIASRRRPAGRGRSRAPR